MPTYTFLRADPDNRRTYYTRQQDGLERLYCIQDDGSGGRQQLAFYVCSREGEPVAYLGRLSRGLALTFPAERDFDKVVLP